MQNESSLSFMLFLILETPAMTISAAFQLQHKPCAAMFWLKLEGRSSTTAAQFVLLARPCVPRHSCFYTSLHCARVHRNNAFQSFQADWGTDNEPSTACLCSHSSNEPDFGVNCAQTWARGPWCENRPKKK